MRWLFTALRSDLCVVLTVSTAILLTSSARAADSVAVQWARVVNQVQYDDLQDDIVAKLRLTVCDWVGAVAYTSQLPQVRRFRDVTDTGGRCEATELVTGRKLPLGAAAAINGFAIHGHEVDDSNLRNTLRASCIAVPAPLAAAEFMDCDGKEFLAALAVSYQLSDRLATAMNHQPEGKLHRRGWMPSSVCGGIAAAAACAKLFGLTDEQVVSAMGLAVGGANGLFQYYHDGTDEKKIHVARSQQIAAESTRLAKAGFRGAPGCLDGPAGLFAALGFKADAIQLTEDLMQCDAVLHVKPKFFSCSQGVIPWLETLTRLRKHHPFDVEDVQHITVHITQPPETIYYRKINDFRPPVSIIDAQMSVNLGIAFLLLEGDAFVEQYTPKKIADQRTLDLARRVRPAHDLKRPGLLEVELRDGRVFEATYSLQTLYAPYEPVVVDYRRKFDRLAARLSAPQRDALWQHAYTIAEAESMAHWCRELVELLRLSPVASTETP